MAYRNFAVFLIFFIFLYLVRFRLFYCTEKLYCQEGNQPAINHILACKCNKIKPNSFVRVKGTVSTIPTILNNIQYFKVGSFSVQTSNGERYKYGENLTIVGKWEGRVIGNLYLENYLVNPQITRINGPHKPFDVYIVNSISIIREKAAAVFHRNLPNPQSGLLAGITLGGNESLDPELWQALKRTGTLHLTAASGMNVSMVTMVILDLLLGFLSRKLAYFVTLVFILIYIIVSGGSASVVRAGIMSGLVLLGLSLGREVKGSWALCLAASVMLIFSPTLITDVGFLLSVAAMAGIVFIRPELEKISIWGKALPESVRNAFLDTVSAQVFTLPILYFTFGQFQPLSIIPNILVVSVIPLITMLGFVLLVCGLIYLPLSYPAAWLSWAPLTYIIKVIELCGKLF